jgi:hypothetical protein
MVALRSLRTALPALLLAGFIAGRASAQTCADPSRCADTPVLITFESLAAGTSVEGPGAVYPPLTIQTAASPLYPSCTVGSARVIEELNPFPYGSYSTASGGINGCLTGVHGFADSADCVLDYQFTFGPGYTVSCFSVLMLDYADYFPYGGSSHSVLMEAFDASNVIVDTFTLTEFGGTQLGSGDACDAQPGDPGRTTMFVTAPGIKKVRIRFTEAPDPNVGFDDLAFCLQEPPTPVVPGSWSGIKARLGN